jgi:hypothetical protein
MMGESWENDGRTLGKDGRELGELRVSGGGLASILQNTSTLHVNAGMQKCRNAGMKSADI